MAKQIINVGSLANDKTGDALRTAFGKTNANFTELYDSVAAGNTGAIRFEGIAIVGDTSDLPQGSIELVPNDGTIPTGQPNEGDSYTSWGQYLRIYPTWNADTPHIHIAAGTGENSEGDIFLGDDSKYVQVNHDGTVSISTNTNLWEFDTVGDLNLPDNGGIVFDRANTTIRVGMGFHIASGEGISLDAIDETDPENLVYKNWYFDPNGSVSFPDSTVQETAWAGGRVVIVPTSSIGITGDKQGDIAFNGSYIYYCAQDFIEASYSSTIVLTYSGSYPSIVKGSIPQPQAGWELVHNGDTYILDANATEGNPGEWSLSLASSISVTVGDSVTIGPASVANIWKRVAWSNDTW